MNTPLPALQWKQNGVNHIVKLLPGGRIGALSNEILAEIRESNGKPDAKNLPPPNWKSGKKAWLGHPVPLM